MKVRLLNAGGYETCSSMEFPCEIDVESKDVLPRVDDGPYGIVLVPVSTLLEHGGTKGFTTEDKLAFVHDVGPMGLMLGLGNEAELVEE